MCGIVGYVGAQSALDVVMAGLKRLEAVGSALQYGEFVVDSVKYLVERP